MRRGVTVGVLLCGAGLASVLRGGASETARVAPAVTPGEREDPTAPGEREDRTGPLEVHRASAAELAVQNRVALAEAARLQRRAREARLRGATVPGTSWVSLGPTEGNEQSTSRITDVIAGRINDIVVDPRDPDVVYLATSGGGVWKTFDLGAAAGAHWLPISDTLPSLAAGALAIDREQPDVLYLGSGDFFHAAGNTVTRTGDGGVTWGAPVVLAGSYPGPRAFPAKVRAIRSIGVHGSHVLVGTDVGLFASSDAGASFALIDLPNRSGDVLPEAIWTVVHIGADHWVASGVTGCDEGSAPLPPRTKGQDPGPSCRDGNNGAIWISSDGATWSLASMVMPTGIGRIDLAAGAAGTPDTTAVYAIVGAVDHSQTLGVWRSLDGGRSWTDATGTLANPTIAIDDGVNIYRDCADLNLGFGQTWYDQAIAVDPSNPDNVVIGGALCGARTRNGTASPPTWELVSDWSPGSAYGRTDDGPLDYVHADWQTATVVAAGGQVRTLVGTDGGIFVSTNVFDRATRAASVTWTAQNRGLTTHLMYSVASGDPATGDPFLLFAGLQDNGTRYRVRADRPSVFDEVVGGDGIGATVHAGASGTTYWASAQFSRVYCQPAVNDCASATSWKALDALAGDPAPGARPAIGDDGEPFSIHYASVATDPVGQSVLTHSMGQIFVAVAGADGKPAWHSISQDITPDGVVFTNVAASSTIPGLYGAAAASGFRGSGSSPVPFYVTAQGNTPSTWIAARPVQPAGPATRMSVASSIAFPPVLPAGTAPGQVYVGAFTGALDDPDRTPPPDDQGRLYRTRDFGQTWSSIVGADPAHRLPNVAVYVVKYDPVAPATLYAGTDLGVYVSTDDAATWDRMGDGLPIVPVRDLYVAKNQEFIRVATFGRGLWEMFPSAGASRGSSGDGDYDRNQRIDWIDVAATASRLGTTPATQPAPRYTWLLDVSAGDRDPPVQAIDEADLAVLLGKLGGHP